MSPLASSFDGRVGASAMAGVDEFTQWVAGLPGAGQSANRSAIGSVGYMLKSTLKETVNGNVANWPTLSVATRVIAARPPRPADTGRARATREVWERRREEVRQSQLFDAQFSGRLKFWGTLAALAVYKVADDASAVVFGFMAGIFGYKTRRTSSGTRREVNEIRDDIVWLAKLLTEGDQQYQLVTRRTQNYLRGIGLFSPKVGSYIAIPSRPLIGPHYLRVRDQIPAVYREKFWASFARKAAPGEAWMLSAANQPTAEVA